MCLFLTAVFVWHTFMQATRFANDVIYTYTGPILLAVNPFQRLPLYTKEVLTVLVPFLCCLAVVCCGVFVFEPCFRPSHPVVTRFLALRCCNNTTPVAYCRPKV